MSVNNSNYNNSQYMSSIDPSLFQSVTDQAQLNSIINNMTSDTLDRPIKFAKPKYSDVKKTYEELAPITKETIEMPTKHSHKVRTTEPVFLQPKVYDENAHMSQIINNDNYYDDIPLPTNSVINNLIKESVLQSNLGPEFQSSQIQSQIGNSNMGSMKMKSKIDNSNIGSMKMQSKIDNSNIGSLNMQSKVGKSKMESKIGQTKYEQRLRQEEEEKYKKSLAMKQSNQQSKSKHELKMTELPQPEVYEGEGLLYSTKIDNNSLKPSMNINNINQSNIQSTMKKSNYPNQSNIHSHIDNNKSVYPSKVHQSNNPQQSISSNKNFKESNQMKMQQSNLNNNQSTKNSNISQNQSNVHQSSSNQSINNQNIPNNQSNMYQQSMKQSNAYPPYSQSKFQKSNIPHESQIQSKMSQKSQMNNNQSSKQSKLSNTRNDIDNNQFSINSKISTNNKNISNYPNFSSVQKSNVNNNMNSKINKNPIGVYETTMMPSTIGGLNNNNKSNINMNSKINKNPIGVYETTMMPSNIEGLNNNKSNNNMYSKIKKNPIGVYETALMSSSIEGSNNNVDNKSLNIQYAPSVHVSKVNESNTNNKISVEPQPGEYNIMNNKTTMDNYTIDSFPTESNAGKRLTKTSIQPNPFQKK